MKKVIILISLILVVLASNAERQKVYSIIKQEKPKVWYENQAKLWEAYLQTNKNSADAWLNYYTAMRMIKIKGGAVNQKALTSIVEKIKEHVPNSFEYHYISFWDADFNKLDENFHHLNKAYQLAPNRTEILDDFVTYYEIKRNKEKLKEVSSKWYASGDMSSGLYYWNYNMLQTLERDAILITSGDNDTYPALVLQYAKGIRSDINVLNHSLLGLTEYRDRYFRELGIPTMPFTADTYETYPSFQEAMMKYIMKNTDRPIYFAVSADPRLYKSFKSEVYNVGMAYKWSKEKFDNIAVIKKNYERNYLTDYLKFNPTSHIGNGVVDHMNANYLISLLPLYNHYVESDDVLKNDLEVLINGIAKKNKLENRVAKILGKSKRSVASYVIKDPSKLEKSLVKIKDGFYGSSTEISNEMYDLFLTDLLKQKRYDELDMAKANAVNWRSLLPKKFSDLSDKDVFPNGHPSSPNFPVVNISHEAAELYCQWLTEVYNGLDHKKKKFETVEFRLPTKEEWESLALGGKEQSAYSWGGPYIRNAKGCFLANVKAEGSDKYPTGGKYKECIGPACAIDGGTFPVAIESYYPNDFGLYNITGNVSEMVRELGVVKGGSWNTDAGSATITNHEKINAPSPEVGFRVVMIVK